MRDASLHQANFHLPASITHAEYTKLKTQTDVWSKVMQTICQLHGLFGEQLVRFGDGTDAAYGTCIAFAVGSHTVIKLFPPFHRHLFEAEYSVAVHVFGKLNIATPEIYAHGAFDGWPYLIMSRLQGTYLSDIWDRLEHSDQLRLVLELATALTQLHALPTNNISHLDSNWKAFVERRINNCVQRHREQEVSEHWLQQIPDFLAHAAPLYPADFAPAIISGDIHQYHLLAKHEHGHWRLTGLFDFDDALLGFPEYDLAAAGLFMMAGHPTLLRSFLLKYGYRESELTKRLSHRLMAYTLLHRYRPFNWVLQEFAGFSCSTLEEVAKNIYAIQ